jgi:hypothetical protein
MAALNNAPAEGWTPDKPYVRMHVRAQDLCAVRAIFDSAGIGIYYTRPVLYVINHPEAAPHLDTFVFAYVIDWPQPPHAPSLDGLAVRLLHDAGIEAMVSGVKVCLPESEAEDGRAEASA